MQPFSSKDKHDPELILEALQIFSAHYAKFDSNDKNLLDVFGLTGIENPKLWAKIIIGEKQDSRDIARPYYRGMSFIIDYLPKIVDLLKQDNLVYSKTDHHEVIAKSRQDDKAILTVILPENEKESSNPERLIKILQSINLFYDSNINN